MAEHRRQFVTIRKSCGPIRLVLVGAAQLAPSHTIPEYVRQFSPQFKAEAVQMVIETGKPIAAVARDLGINDGTLGNWVNAWRREHPEPDQPLCPVERARVRELEEDNRRLRMENEFLKKAAAFFAREHP